MPENLKLIGASCIIAIVYSFALVEILLFYDLGFNGRESTEMRRSSIVNLISRLGDNTAKAEALVNDQNMEVNHRNQCIPVTDSSSEAQLPFLLIGVPTMPREGQKYLETTLERLISELDEIKGTPFGDSVEIIVQNNAPGKHELYEYMKGKYRQDDRMTFVNNEQAEQDGKIADGKRQQQCLHVHNLLSRAAEKSTYYLFLEDDFLLCPNAFNVIYYLIMKANRYYPEGWISIRFSYGFNGYIMHSNDLGEFSRYIRKHYKRRPVDHLAVEWMARETDEARKYIKDRKLVAFHTNLLEHIGKQSTIQGHTQENFPKCFSFIGHPVNFEAEAFDPKKCPNDDLWPCERSREGVDYFYIPRAQ